MNGLIVDLFAGGGGASTGIESALGRPVDVAVNHSAIALAVHAANHPRTKHLPSDVWDVDPFLVTRGRPVGLLWASPDCTHHSRAKGGKPRSKNLRSLAHVVTHWARAVHPALICIENVSEFAEWGPLDDDGHPVKDRRGETFESWCGQLRLLGYRVEHRILDSSLYGAPTKRKRLFVVARAAGRPITWPEPTHGPRLRPVRSAAECIDWSLPCPSIFERARPLAEKTLWRVAQGIKRYVLDSQAPFLVQYNGQSGALSLERPLNTISTHDRFGLVSAFLAKHYGGVVGQEVSQPTGTITAKDHHAVVAATIAKFRGTHPSQPGCADPRAPLPTISAGGIHVAAVQALLTRHGVQPGRPIMVDGEQFGIIDIGMRMLDPSELLRAQFGDFAAGYDMTAAKTKSAQVRLIGNSVCPDVARALVAANATRSRMEAAA